MPSQEVSSQAVAQQVPLLPPILPPIWPPPALPASAPTAMLPSSLSHLWERAGVRGPLLPTAAPHPPLARARRNAAGAAQLPWPTVAALLLVQVLGSQRGWLFSRLVRGPRAWAGVPGLRFARVLGSGHQGGFGLRPSLERGGLFALFDHEADAEAFIERSAAVLAYRERACECLTATLRASAVRGSWNGMTMGVAAAVADADAAAAAAAAVGAGRLDAGAALAASGANGLDADIARASGSARRALQDAGAGPIAALTRASIRPLQALHFWRHAAPAQAALAGAEGCLLAAGLGEAPLLRQATFSLWRDAAALDAYARRGAHEAAIRAAWQQGYFSESMFVRFVPLRVQGQWQGRSHAFSRADKGSVDADAGAHAPERTLAGTDANACPSAASGAAR